MAAEMDAAAASSLSQTHEQLRRKTVKHRVAAKGEDRGGDVDTGSAKDVAIDFVGGVVSGISGIVVGQVCFIAVCACVRAWGRVENALRRELLIEDRRGTNNLNKHIVL